MADMVVIALVAAIVGAAGRYIYKEKKKGVTCIGCPHSCSCAAKAAGKGCGSK